jgi:hypothetical protein
MREPCERDLVLVRPDPACRLAREPCRLTRPGSSTGSGHGERARGVVGQPRRCRDSSTLTTAMAKPSPAATRKTRS